MVNGFSKFICLCGFMVMVNIAMAQYQVKVTSWKHDIQDLSQRDSKVLDQNGERCALIKFETAVPGLFSFSLGAQQIEKRENKDDEVWIWISADVKKITIRCTDCTPLKDYRVSLKAGNVYRAQVTTGLPQETSTHQNLNLYCENTPFYISIDGAAPILNETKNYYAELTVGTHDLLVSSKLYKPYSGTIRLYRSQPLNDTIQLEPNYGTLIINCSQPDYVVRVDEEEFPSGDIHIEPGFHKVTVLKDRYETFEAMVDVQLQQKHEIAAVLKPAYALFTIMPTEEETEIWVDGKFRGHNTTQVELGWGEHLIEGKREGYDTWEYSNHEFGSASPKTIRIPRLNRQYGALRISFYPTDASVFVDGQEVLAQSGVYSVSRIPTGAHFVQIRKADYKTERDSFTVVAGKAFARDYQLQHMPHGMVSITTDDDVAIYRWNETDDSYYYLARGSYSGKMPVGKNTITLENMNEVKCQYGLFVNEGDRNPSVKFPYMRKLMVRSNVVGRPQIRLQTDRSFFDIKLNKKIKVEPQKYQIIMTKRGYQTYTDSIDMSIPYVNKEVYYATMKREGDTLDRSNNFRSPKLLQRYYDNAGKWFIGIIDFGYTFSFVDTAHIVTAGVLPFRYRMFSASLLDVEMRVTGHMSDSVIKTLSYKPKISLVVPCGEGFAFTFYGGMLLNLYDAFGPNPTYKPGTHKRVIKSYLIGGASMLINGVGAFPMNIFGEYHWPMRGVEKPTEHKEQWFRVGINFAIGVDR